MSKIKVGFEPDGSWDRGDVRKFFTNLTNSDAYELWIITTSTDTEFIENVQNSLGLEDAFVKYTTTANKQADITGRVDIYLDDSIDFVNTINTIDPKPFYPVYLSKQWNLFKLEMKYVTDFYFIINNLLD